MNDLSNAVLIEHHTSSCKPVPSAAIYVLVTLFVVGLSVSTFILVAVHNAFFFLAFVLLSALVVSFIAWNRINWKRKAAVYCFLNSLPESDLGAACEGQIVKITGPAYCGSISLESSYERATGCIYSSTLLYEYGEFGWGTANSVTPCFQWGLTYCERFSTDFYITDQKSGISALVKAGSGCKVFPIIVESKLVTTTRQCRNLSPHLKKWLEERNLPAEARLLRLEEGYVQEGSLVTVIGVLHRNNDLLMIVHPQEFISTGCLWQKFFLPVEIDGLVIAVPDIAMPTVNPGSGQNLEQ